jgi:hypothetical protein
MDFTPEVLAAFGEGFLLDDMVRSAGFGGFRKKLQRIWDFVQKAPRSWTKLKSFFGIDNIKELPDVIKEWAAKGKKALGTLAKKLKTTFPMSLYFVDRGKMPGLTDLVQRILERSPKLQSALRSINTRVVEPLDRLMDKHLPTLGRPLKAAIFIYIWLQVVEITWDFDAIMAGFTGGMSLGELFSSFPESALGAFFSLFGLGYAFLPIAISARILWLVGHKYLSWVPGKGLKVHWDRITGERGLRPELVPV